jgi:hypothetical protein
LKQLLRWRIVSITIIVQLKKVVMNPLIGMLASQLGGPVMQQISQQIGAPQENTQSAVGMALPMLLSAMGNHAATPEGAQAINQAAQHHDGSILDDVMGFVGNAGAGGMGGALLGQVLGGGSQNAIASAIGQSTGLNSGMVTQLLALVMPLVMGALGKASQQQGGIEPSSIVQMLGAASGGNDSSEWLLRRSMLTGMAILWKMSEISSARFSSRS